MTLNRRFYRSEVSRSAASGLAALLLCAGAAHADDVTITSRQGNLSVTGRVVGYDGTWLQIESEHGPLTLAYAGVTCAGADCPDPANYVPQVRMSGARRMTDLLIPALLDGYARERDMVLTQDAPDPAHHLLTLSDNSGAVVLKVELRGSNAAEGFADLVSFDADVALSFREPTTAEQDRATEVGIGPLGGVGQSVIIGTDALVPIVSPLNTVTTIDPVDLAAVFSGAATDWAGQPGTPTLHLGPVGDGQADAFLALLPEPIDESRIIRHVDTAALSAAVAADPGAIGVTALGATGVAQPLSLRGGCGLTAVPRLTAIKTQDYPLTTPLFLYLAQPRQTAAMRDFLTFLRSPAAQLIVRRAGFADQGVVPIPLDDQGERFAHAITIAGPDTTLLDLQRMVGLMHARARISLTFRFANGTIDLDATSAANLVTLAQDVRDGVYAGRELLLIGFSDGEGDADTNRTLSAARSDAVLADLRRLLGSQMPPDVRIVTAAFGEALPMGCDDTAWGRRMNRRVEVWVGD